MDNVSTGPTGSPPGKPGPSGGPPRPPRPPLPRGRRRPASVLTSFALPAIAFLIAGAVFAVLAVAGAGGEHAAWLSLHLVFAGGISQMLIGAAQFFSTAYLATEPPPERVTRAQLIVWNAGVLLVAVGLPVGVGALTAAGGVLLLIGLGLYAGALHALAQGSLRKPRWTLRWYYASALSLAVGSLIGASLASDAAWTHGSLFGAHMACNLAGWLGGAIIGTLHTFFPTLTNSQLRFQRLEGPTFLAWFVGVAALVIGEGFAVDAIIWAGWLLLLAAAVMLAVNVVACLRAANGPLSVTALLVAIGQAFLLAGLVTAVVMSAVDGPQSATTDPWRATLGVLLGGGWIGLTFAGSLVQLMGVLARVRNLGAPEPKAPPAWLDRTFAAGLALALALLAAAQASSLNSLEPYAGAAVVLFALPFCERVLRFARQAARPAVSPAAAFRPKV